MYMSKNIFITGGYGFIGTNFVKYLLKNCDYNIIVFDKLTYASNLRNMENEKINPSKRNELEITDVNKYFLDNSEIEYKIIDNDWIDAGTIESLFIASEMERNLSRHA